MGNNNLTVSVIIPTYHRPALLLETLESVWAQTILPDEIIIGDDSRDNETENLINAVIYDKSPVPIRYFHHKPSLREVKNVDFQYQHASGDLLLHLHDDDPIFPKCIELLKKPFTEHDEIIASFGLQKIIDEQGNVTNDQESLNNSYYRTADRAGIVDGFMAGAVAMFPNNGFMVRREAALSIGYSDLGKSGLATDFYFGFRLGQLQKPFYFVNDYTAYCRLTPDSQSRTGFTDNSYQTVKILLENCPKEKISGEIYHSLRKRMPIAISYAAVNDKSQALKWLFSKYYINQIFSPRWIKRLLVTGNILSGGR